MNHTRNFSLLAYVALAITFHAVLVPSAYGDVTPVHTWRMGENQGAQNGTALSTAVDTVAGKTLILSGSPVCSSSVAPAAASNVGSTLGLDFFAPGVSGTNAVIPSLVNNFGIELWVKPGNTTGNKCLAYNGNTASDGWGIYQVGATYQCLFGNVAFFGSAPASAGTWTHLALVRDNGIATFYVNGVAAGTNALAPASPTGRFGVAAKPTDTTQDQFVGVLDELRVFTFYAGLFTPNDLLLNATAANAVAGNFTGVAGAVWKKTSAPQEDWDAVASSADGTKLLGVTHIGGTYLSTNSGDTWTATGISGVGLPGRRAAISADGTKLFVARGNIHVSVDGGATWTPRDAARTWTAIACSADGTKVVAVTAGGQIYTSTDSGTGWTARETSRGWGDVASSSDGTKLVASVGGADAGNGAGQIYTSTDSGVTWTPRADEQVWGGVACSADGTKLVAGDQLESFYGTYMGRMYLSGDSGANWSGAKAVANWACVASSSDGTRLVAASQVYLGPEYPQGMIMTSTNSGASWDPGYAPGGDWRGVASSADGRKLVACSWAGGIYVYSQPAAPAPALNLATAGGNGFISWPWPSAGYVLQQNTNLMTTNWVNVPNAQAVVNQVIAPATNAQNFYRLIKP